MVFILSILMWDSLSIFKGTQMGCCKYHTWNWQTLNFAFLRLEWNILKCILWFHQDKKTSKYSGWQFSTSIMMQKMQNGESNVIHFWCFFLQNEFWCTDIQSSCFCQWLWILNWGKLIFEKKNPNKQKQKQKQTKTKQKQKQKTKT